MRGFFVRAGQQRVDAFGGWVELETTCVEKVLKALLAVI